MMKEGLDETLAAAGNHLADQGLLILRNMPSGGRSRRRPVACVGPGRLRLARVR